MSKNPLVGCWKLISCDAIRQRGTRVPVYGKNPCGRLYYDDLGNMSVHIMRAGRNSCGDGNPLTPENEAGVMAQDGYQAYFSTYDVDVEHMIVRHKVLGSLHPDWTGTTQVRYYELRDGNRLMLSTAPLGSPPKHGPIFELVWERVS